MKPTSQARPYLIRLLVIILISFTGVWLFNELVYRLQKDDYDRAPQTVKITIPLGAAEKVKAGEDTVTLPAEMVFILGDVLEVENNDLVAHQLGPVWVPPGSTGKLALDVADNLAYSCSFRTNNYLNLDIRQGTSFSTRLTGLFLAGPATVVFMYIYSLLIFPVGKKKKARSDSSSPQQGQGVR